MRRRALQAGGEERWHTEEMTLALKEKKDKKKKKTNAEDESDVV